MAKHSSRRRPAPARFDPFLDDAALRRGYRLLVDGQWDGFERELGLGAGGWLLRSTLVSDDAAVETMVFEQFAAARPSGLSLSLLGGAMARDAIALGGDAARPLLVQAETVLGQAAEAQAALADPWVHLVASGAALGIDLGELRSRFEQAQSREPFRPDACRAYLDGLGHRSPPAMFDFAHWVEREAPPGSPAREVLPRAHLQFGISLAHGASLSPYLARPETVAELAPALASFLAATRGGLPPPDPTPSSPADPVHLPALNAYGLAMTVSDRVTARLTRECFERIDNRPTSYPWLLYPGESVTEVFAEIQRTQLRTARRHDRSR